MSAEQPAKSVMEAMEQEGRAIRESIGIDHDFSPSRVLYIPCAETVIAEVYYRSTPAQEHRLYARRRSERRYTCIGDPQPGVHYKNPIAHLDIPIVYFSVWTTSLKPDGGASGSNWSSIQRVHLADYRIEPVACEGELIIPPQYESSWISELHSLTPDGRTIICTCALERAVETGTKVDYCLCEIDIASKHTTLITLLEAVWF